ncbi:GNAT family N-acetyltransferase [Streptomyces sp. AK02-01A]|uniref:GNAT family N-acetyltransferase n=1 Tax=Streptomyces sp. AK02-01A TaxID=3028648 RepID=UPI0029BC0BA3|nr:GNAT family N-acetyltransferase [Streptomyces sp. AK02-01A]MDX3852647.1 GNAT family N-acetyltransferase [Streptomyces sp. AK02-01A]
MTTTLRPTGPLQHTDDGGRSRAYEVCVNSRPVGTIEIRTDPGFGHRAGVVGSLRIDGPDRRRGRGTVAALAAEEVLRGWGCDQVLASVPADAAPALGLLESLGYTERSRNMLKDLPREPPALPAGLVGRPMNDAEYQSWLAQAVDGYAQNWIDRGVPPEQARAKSEASHREFLREGLSTSGVSMSVLLHEGSVVGHVWVARREVRPGEWGSYVFDVAVTEGLRGKGFGRALMQLAEGVALGSGSTLLGLHVFASNTPAVRLYESLGYVTTNRNFYKQLV